MIRLRAVTWTRTSSELITKWTSVFVVGVCLLLLECKSEDVRFRGMYSGYLTDAQETVPRRVSASGEHISHDLRCTQDGNSVHFNVSIENIEYLLILQASSNFIAPSLVIERRHKKSSTKYKPAKSTLCHFQGIVYGHEKSKVALSACNGLTGMIHTKDGEYYIEPVHYSMKTIGPGHKHLIYKRSAAERSNQPKRKRKRKKRKHSRECGTKEPKRMTFLEWQREQDKLTIQEMNHHKNKYIDDHHNTKKHKHEKTNRIKRSISREHFVEALVVADYSMVEFHEYGDVETYLLSIMNMVSALYLDPAVGNLIHIVVVKIILIDDQQAEPKLNVTVNAQQTLRNFCKWQKKMNPPDEEDPEHHDVAILITRKNICVNRDTPCSTLGVAHIGGMCRPDKSCSVNEDTGILLAHTISHELGHNFGMYHDTDKVGCKGRVGSMLHVMTPNLQAETTEVSWSRCSRREITTFLDRGLGKCLYDKPSEDNGYSYPDLPAGAMYQEDYQCKLQFGEGSVSCATDKEEICKMMWCLLDGNCTTQLTPAAPGTNCGKHKWCQNKECVPILEPLVPIDGGWGDWSPWTECSRTCGAGVSVTERHCDHPIPASGGSYCIGERRRYRMCNTDPCPENEPTFRAYQCSKYDGRMHEGKQYKWLPHFSQSEPCILYCTDANETVIVPWGEFAADGTPCNVGSRDVCIYGVCKKVGCDWMVDSKAEEDDCGICNGDGTKCDKMSGEYHKQSSSAGYREVVVIPPGARNIRIQEMNHSKNYISIGSATSRNFYLNGKRHITLPGEYTVAGTPALYKRNDQLEKIHIPGPIKEPIVIYILFRGKVHNPGVEYKYSFWKRGTTKQLKYSWVAGLWSQCSATCGGGTQVLKPYCQESVISSLGTILEGTARYVDEMMCDPASKPNKEMRTCNDITCPSYWWTGPWQSCPTTCAIKGEIPMRRRSVMCVDGHEMALPDHFCDKKAKPLEFSKCKPLPECGYDYDYYNNVL